MSAAASRAAVAIVALAAAGCARAAPPPAVSSRGWEQGVASYYADSLAGRRTASGERYDPAALTCAHRTLPFGTWVDVVRSDGRAVRVRVNDRGPFVAGRVVDLSKRAASDLGMLRAGVLPVWVRPVAIDWSGP